MDFSMPVMDGITASNKIRQILNDYKIPKSNQPFIIGVTAH